MKYKRVIILTIILFLVNLLHAQTIRFGIKGGVSASLLYGPSPSKDPNTSVSPSINPTIGATVEYKIKSNMMIQSGLFFINRGVNSASISKGDKSKTKFQSRYIKIPINLSYQINITDRYSFFVHTGPFFGYAIDGKLNINNKSGNKTYQLFSFNNIGPDSSPEEQVIQGESFGRRGYRRFDAGIELGVSYDLSNKLYVDLSFELGLVNMVTTTSRIPLKNISSGLSIGYRF